MNVHPELDSKNLGSSELGCELKIGFSLVPPLFQAAAQKVNLDILCCSIGVCNLIKLYVFPRFNVLRVFTSAGTESLPSSQASLLARSQPPTGVYSSIQTYIYLYLVM